MAERDSVALAEKSRKLLKTTLKKAGKASLAAALVPLALATTASAQYSSRVDSTVTPNGGVFKYEFTVVNTTNFGSGIATGAFQEIWPRGWDPWIVNWELPIFDINDVTNITAPDGWTWEIINPGSSTAYYNNPNSPYGHYRWDWTPGMDPTLIDDPNAYGPNPNVFLNPPLIIHWYTEAVQEEGGLLPLRPIGVWESLSGFGFESAYSATNAPYLSSWFELPPVAGDPPIPGSSFSFPNSPAYREALNPIPEPISMTLAGIGLATVAALRRRKSGN